jgi:hypothetical protein
MTPSNMNVEKVVIYNIAKNSTLDKTGSIAPSKNAVTVNVHKNIHPPPLETQSTEEALTKEITEIYPGSSLPLNIQ